MNHTRTVVLGLMVLSVVGCSDGGDDGDTIISLVRGSLTLTASGASGSAGDGGVGGAGGTFDGTASGNIFVGMNPPPLGPAVPTPPTAGDSVASWTDTQTITSGNAILAGTVTASTTGFEATLTVTTGDLVILGTLRSADNGTFETGISINVPAGTVWILGTIRTGRVDGVNNGDEAGLVTINAQRIIFSGTIDGRGEAGPDGGDGAFVTFSTEGAGGQTSQVLSGGSMLLQGGNASGPDGTAGDGGAFQSYATASSNGNIHVQGTTFQCDGGSAQGAGAMTGGQGGIVDLQGDAGVFFSATLNARGGGATSSTGDSIGGSGGAFFANDGAILESGPVSVFGSILISGGAATSPSGNLALGGDGGQFLVVTGADANLGTGSHAFRGGNGTSIGGHGGGVSYSAGVSPGIAGDIHFNASLDVSDGTSREALGGIAGFIDFDTTLGDIHLSGTLTANGGNGSDAFSVAGAPSAGGDITAATGDLGGSIVVFATLRANGGSDNDGSDPNDGAPGGLIRLAVSNSTGSIYLEPGSLLQADGGNAGGPTSVPFGGDGGFIDLLTGGGSVGDGTSGGNITMRGTIAARGGLGRSVVGSFGGFGGAILVDSDSAFAVGGVDGRGGNITLEAGGVIDASGGSAGSGGDALNDGFFQSVTVPIAVTFEADGIDSDDSAENGIVLNFGLILARGVGTGAFGGDVLFDGLNGLFAPGPDPGTLDLFGDGALGDFLSQ
jgi:hypothetical protein